MRIEVKTCLFLLPNLFTLSSIFCGFCAVVLSAPRGEATEHLYQASLLIIFAMFFDILDGRVARLTRTQSAFGVQIDSLADLVSFGAAPAVLIYHWSLADSGPAGLAAAFAFVASGAIRLARFNVMSTHADGKPHKPAKYVVGLPVPGAAGILVSLVVADHVAGGSLSQTPGVVMAVVIGLSLLMVSAIPFRSFKDLRMNRRTYLLVATTVGSSVFLAIRLHVVFALAWLLVGYVALGLVEGILSAARRLRRRPDEDDDGVLEA